MISLPYCSKEQQHFWYLGISDQCQVQNGGLRLVSMQGTSAGINATTDYGSQTFTQDDTSQLVTSSSITMPINRHLAAVAAMNGHVKSEGGRGTDTPPPPCSTPPPTYEQAILGGACIARRREGKYCTLLLTSIQVPHLQRSNRTLMDYSYQANVKAKTTLLVDESCVDSISHTK